MDRSDMKEGDKQRMAYEWARSQRPIKKTIAGDPRIRQGMSYQIELQMLRNGYIAGYSAASQHAHAALEEAEARLAGLKKELATIKRNGGGNE